MDNENSQKEPASKIETPTPKSKFEDSPVFNFINNLSPFEPVKSFSSAQTFSSLSFTSPPPPVFASPHPNFHRESRFFRCQHSVDRSKALGDGSVSKEDREVDLNKDATLEDEEEEDTETSCELPQILSSDGQSPPHHGEDIVTQTLLPPSDPPLGEDNNGSSMNRLQKIPDSQEEENGTPDSRRLMADAAAELLVFRSPNDSEAFTCLVDKISSSERRFFAGVKHHHIIPANGSSNDNEPLAVVPNQLVSNVHRGSMRRRCLDFEVPGKRKKDDDQQTVCDNNKPESSSSKCVVPGIGLHLNAIAMASRNTKISITHEYSSSEEVQNTFSGSITPVHSQDTVPETLDQAESQPGEEAPKALVFEELIPDSLQKKKQVLEGGEGEGESSCKRCNCKKSKCLKLYCECFAAGVYCIEPCSCVDCFNKPIHEDTVLATRKQIESRNPLAFAPKVIRNSDSSIMDTSDDASKTPASARHKRGCNCKKSNCLKKYCECYQSGVGCSINCRCEGCKNAFGRKDAYLHTIMESKQEDDHETYEKRTEKIQQNSKEVEQNPQPSTPLPPYRNLVVHQPFLSRNKLPPTQFFPRRGSSSFRKPDCDVTQSMNEKKTLETVTEDKTEIMPDILNTSPIKANSPNSKRVSPAHIGPSEPGSILGKRSNGRKLILRSIPAFPSLNPNQ